jgi:catechol 2,3-dioxygenase-like lactoylglutathione lyase family enzyme
MNRMIAQLSLVVRDYDEAIDFYASKLGFVLIEDTPLSETKRWVVVAPTADAAGCRLLLAKAAGEEQLSRVGDQTGGRVFLFLHTDDIARDHARLIAAGVRIVREPAVMPYGTVLVFADLYGNLWDLIQPNNLS